MPKYKPTGICFLFIFLASLTSLSADSEAMPVYELEPLLLVAPNVWIPDADIHRSRISSAKPVDLAAILSSQLPEAALTRKGPLAGDIVLRGFSRDNVIITVDDNKTFCACPNRMDPPAFHVSSQQIETISVRSGPFSVDQGGSVGGTVAVQTTAPSTTAFLRGYGYYGSYDYLAGGMTMGYPLSDSLSALGGFYHQRGGVYEDGSGVRFTQLPGSNYQAEFVDETAFDVFTAEAKAAYKLGEKGSVVVNYAIQDARDVLYPGLRMDAPSDTMNRASVALRLPIDSAIADELEGSLAFSHVDHDMQDSFRTSANNMGGAFVARGYFMRTQAKSAYVGGRLELSKSLEADTYVRYGADVKRRYWDANNIIGNMRNDMLPDTLTESVGIWSVYEYRSGEWAFESGMRLDISRSKARESIAFLQGVRGTSTNHRSDVLPSVYALVSRDMTPSLNSFAGLGLASRTPDPQERYMNLNRPAANSDWVGNPDLDPVYNLEAQGGMRWNSLKWDAQITAFHAWLMDYVYLARLNVGAGATSYENIDARLYGLSMDAGWNALDCLRIEAGLAWQEGVKESRPTNATNNVLSEVPPLRARLAALFNFEDLSIKAEVQHQDDFDRVDADLGEVSLPGWTVLNLASSYRLNEQVSLSMGVDNVLDRTYAVSNAFVRDPFRSSVVVNEPGRFWFMRAGLEF